MKTIFLVGVRLFHKEKLLNADQTTAVSQLSLTIKNSKFFFITKTSTLIKWFYKILLILTDFAFF